MTNQPQLTDEQITAHLERIQARAGLLTKAPWEFTEEQDALITKAADPINVNVFSVGGGHVWFNWQTDRDAIADVPITEAVALALSRLNALQAHIITDQTAEIARLRAEVAVKDQTIQLIQDHNEELKRVNKALATGKGSK